MISRSVSFAMIAIAIVAPGPAAAHADLLESSPAANAVLLEGPESIELRFTEPIDPDLVFIDLLDATREAVDGIGRVEVSEDGRGAFVDLPPLSEGVYTVTYQVVSTVDGHAGTGLFAFVIDPSGTEGPPAVAPDSTTPAVDGRAIAARWIGLAGALVMLGSLLLWLRSRRLLAPSVGRPPWPLVVVASAIAFAGLSTYLWLAARPIVAAIPERAAGLPLDFAAPFGWTPFAIAMRIALAAMAVVAVATGVAWALGRRRHETAVAMAMAAVAAIALGGMSMAAHAAATGGAGFGLVDWGHLLAVAAWLGGLPAVAVLARRGSAPAGALLRHHGPIAVAAAPIVALTGIANSPLVLGSARDLVGSEYGNLLLAKAGLFSIAVGIGAVNHLALRGRGRAGVAALIGVELVVAALAVSIAATMVTIQPAAARQPALVSSPVAPAHLFGEAGPVSVHATVDLPTPGTQRVLVSLAGPDGAAPDDVQLVFLELTAPTDGAVAPDRIDLHPEPDVPGLFSAEGAYLSVEGDWTVEVAVRRSGALDEAVAFVVPVTVPAPPQLVPPADTGIGVPAPIGWLWGVLPTGPLGWLPAVGAMLALVATRIIGRGSAHASIIGVTRAGLVVVLVLAFLGAGSRALVGIANAPTRGDLADHLPPAGFNASPTEGEAIYLANCASCHGVGGDGSGPLGTLPSAGALHDALARMSSAELSYRIANGIAGVPMPDYAATLTEVERWHLVRYLESWTAH